MLVFGAVGSGEGADEGVVGLPAPFAVGVGAGFGGGAGYGLRGSVGEGDEGAERTGQRGLAQFGPDPGATLPVLRLEFADALGGVGGRGVLQRQESGAERFLFAGVVLRPRLANASEEVARGPGGLRLAEPFGEGRVAVRRFGEPAPHARPCPLLEPQPLGGGERAGLLGIEAEPLAADVAEGGPALRLLRLAERFALAQPAEDRRGRGRG